MRSRVYPRVLDFFPKTRRGATLREAHSDDDQAANVADWKAEHGFKKTAPLEVCYSRETGR